jgi:hypothetical protein
MHPMVTSALIGAGSSAFDNFMSRNEARRAEKFQERMSSTAHQRQMADMRKAGLNPMLSGKYGGASTPAGSQAPIQTSANTLSTLASAYESMQRAKLIDEDIDYKYSVVREASKDIYNPFKDAFSNITSSLEKMKLGDKLDFDNKVDQSLASTARYVIRGFRNSVKPRAQLTVRKPKTASTRPRIAQPGTGLNQKPQRYYIGTWGSKSTEQKAREILKMSKRDILRNMKFISKFLGGPNFPGKAHLKSYIREKLKGSWKHFVKK